MLNRRSLTRLPRVRIPALPHIARGTPYNLVLAATLVNLAPVVLLFFIAQRYFIQGIVISGVKGYAGAK